MRLTRKRIGLALLPLLLLVGVFVARWWQINHPSPAEAWLRDMATQTVALEAGFGMYRSFGPTPAWRSAHTRDHATIERILTSIHCAGDLTNPHAVKVNIGDNSFNNGYYTLRLTRADGMSEFLMFCKQEVPGQTYCLLRRSGSSLSAAILGKAILPTGYSPIQFDPPIIDKIKTLLDEGLRHQLLDLRAAS